MKRKARKPRPRKLKVAFASAEAVPFIKTGGLADVAGSLPKALSEQGCEVIVILPLYGGINRDELSKTEITFYLNLGNSTYIATVYTGNLDASTPVYFICQQELFGRPNPYGDAGGDYPDNDRRFVFFNKAVLELLHKLGFRADIIHVNDWHLGLVPVLMKNLPAGDHLKKARSVLSLHNLAYQGLFPAESMGLTGLPGRLFSKDGVEMYGKLAFLKSGILFADGLTAVSPTYAREILSPELGFGLEGVLKKRKKDLRGILNGIDSAEWDPKKDPHLVQNYGHDDLSGKAECRAALMERTGFENLTGRPVIGIVSRLIEQKGFDVVMEAAEEILQLDCFLAVLGTGQKKYEEFFMELRAARPDRVWVETRYDNEMAHMIEAGSDIFLMPSRFEPCGLNQMYSMLYGTPPIVRATGGLKDSVQNWGKGKGTGFVFKEMDKRSLVAAVKRAVSLFGKGKEWKKLMVNGMKKDFSWVASAKLYKGFYKTLLSK